MDEDESEPPELIRDTNIIHRFSDIATEPCTMLTPIEGLNRYRLVSLEEAVEPLVSIVYDVKTRVSIVKKAITKPSNDLSLDESASIALYTMEWEPYTASLYYILNTALRSEDREQLKPWFLYLKLIITAVSRLPSIRLTIYRSLKLNTHIEYEKYQQGQDVIWWGFSACSMNKDISQRKYFLNPGGTRTLFIIECIKGKYIGPHSFNKNDQEVLLLPATQFHVVHCDRRQDDLHKIYLKEVEPESVLLESVLSPALDKSPQSSPALSNRQGRKRGSIQQFFHNSYEQVFKD